jgi:hypothetical protein
VVGSGKDSKFTDESKTPKSEVAVTRFNGNTQFDAVDFLFGCPESLGRLRPLPPFADESVRFLDTLAKALRADPLCASFPDVASFAFWCRKGNIARLKAEFDARHLRLGRGRIFHIAPSNVPINFAFSFGFGLLAGCANTVRVPSRDFPQIAELSRVIAQMPTDDFPTIAAQNALIRYPRNDELTCVFSASADARIIWGGDATIARIRSFPIKPRGIDISFADRVSLALFAEEAVAALSEEQRLRLAQGFYNDTYLMDQNACSSPHLVVWLRRNPSLSTEGRERFWKSLADEALRRYSLSPIRSRNKYTLFCDNAIRFGGKMRFEPLRRYAGNTLMVSTLKELPDTLSALRGTCGLFYEFGTTSLEPLAKVLSEKFQTMTLFGMDRKEIASWIVENGITGIDRIVPVGSALDIGTVWDGYDLIETLTRIIQYR